MSHGITQRLFLLQARLRAHMPRSAEPLAPATSITRQLTASDRMETAILNTGLCYFICYGAPGLASSNVLAIGTNLSTQSFMTLGAPDDCHGTVPPFETPPPCPGGVADDLFSLESYPAPSATPTVLLAIDGNANLGVFGNVYVGGAVIAGAGVGTPNPVTSPMTGSLVSHTGNGVGTGAGDVLLGSTSSYVKCDYGETTASDLSCNAPVRSSISASASPGPVPPCYENNGTACSDTFHIVKNASALSVTTNGACSNNTWCSRNNASISFTGSNAQFSNNKYSCALSSQASFLLNLLANGQTTTSFSIQAYNNSGSSIPNNTDLGISYSCSGV